MGIHAAAWDASSVEEDAALGAGPADLGDGLDGADLVVRELHRHQQGVRAQRAHHPFRAYPPVAIHRHDGELIAARLQVAGGRQDGSVLDRGGDDMPFAGLGAGEPEPRQVRALGGTAGEHDLVGARADQLRHRLPRLLDRLGRGPAHAWSSLAALPKCSVKKGSILSSTRGSTGVVAWWSR